MTEKEIEFADQCVWDSQKIQSKEALDEYLKIVQFVIGTSQSSVFTDCHYDEEKALFLLKLHNYSIMDTLKTLSLQKESSVFQSIQSEKESDCDSENEGDRAQSILNKSNVSQQTKDEDYCFLCGDGGNLLICDAFRCDRVWHIHCAGLQTMPSEEEWFCPSHKRQICRSQQIETDALKEFMCSYCGNAYCATHCPSDCRNYEYAKIEFLCAVCLSQNESPSQRFLLRLKELHKRKNVSIPKQCKLSKRVEIKWFDLYCAVISSGGLSKMQQLSAWDKARKKCGLNKSFQAENIWKCLKGQYVEYLQCYEQRYYPLSITETNNNKNDGDNDNVMDVD